MQRWAGALGGEIDRPCYVSRRRCLCSGPGEFPRMSVPSLTPAPLSSSFTSLFFALATPTRVRKHARTCGTFTVYCWRWIAHEPCGVRGLGLHVHETKTIILANPGWDHLVVKTKIAVYFGDAATWHRRGLEALVGGDSQARHLRGERDTARNMSVTTINEKNNGTKSSSYRRPGVGYRISIAAGTLAHTAAHSSSSSSSPHQSLDTGSNTQPTVRS